jgi:bifunctional DNA-binding transcriptional regulator/antitoxin component of YhaV-PrlF toxin-antitoxin module
MIQSATITSKRQVTIPISIYKKFKLKQGQKVLVSLENNYIKIESASNLVDRLAGSVSLPKSYQKISLDKIIQTAKVNRFNQNNGFR